MEKHIAIYSRKSKFTGKGESIENQINLCKEYAKTHFNTTDENLIIYEDEGYSGGSIQRPMFKKMMIDAQNHKFNKIICYRLDRISRNIADFSQMAESFTELGIDFISITEQFDTSTPMGRAMMMISSVFAQLERETIAERIRDNMVEQSKTGRWLGGNTPTGYRSEQISLSDKHGLNKTAYKLVPVEEEIHVIELLFDKYIELDSIRHLETYCVQNQILSKNNNKLSRFALTNILTNPVYVKADSYVYQYFKENNYNIYSHEDEFNGENGILIYNKTDNTSEKTKNRDISQWILAIGEHKGCIPSSKWLQVQNMLNRNKSKAFRKVRNSESLVSGLLRCGNCGSPMRPKIGRTNKDGETTYIYICENKEVSKKQNCDIKNINGKLLDQSVISEIKKLAENESVFNEQLSKSKLIIEESRGAVNAEITMFTKQLNSNKQSIDNLINSLSENSNSLASKHIINKIEELEKQNEIINQNLLRIKEQQISTETEDNNLSVVIKTLTSFSALIDQADIKDKRNLLRNIVNKIIWDGENIQIILFGFQPDENVDLLPLGDTCR